MCRLSSLIIFSCVVAFADVASAAPIFRWRDSSGGLHFSNRVAAVPGGATEVALPPIVEARPLPRTVRTPALIPIARVLAPARAECLPPDASGVAAAVATRLAATRHLDGLTLIVGGIPVAYDSDIARATARVSARRVSTPARWRR